jgi:hypothetical protein
MPSLTEVKSVLHSRANQLQVQLRARFRDQLSSFHVIHRRVTRLRLEATLDRMLPVHSPPLLSIVILRLAFKCQLDDIIDLILKFKPLRAQLQAITNQTHSASSTLQTLDSLTLLTLQLDSIQSEMENMTYFPFNSPMSQVVCNNQWVHLYGNAN